MKLLNGNQPVRFSLYDDLIDKENFGIYNLQNSVQYFIGIDIETCMQHNHKLYQILKLLCEQDLQIPDSSLFCVLTNANNKFGITINLDAKTKNSDYTLIFSGNICDDCFKATFICKLNIMEKLLLNKYISMVKKGNVNKITV